MSQINGFAGFGPKAEEFFIQLAVNNNKQWFEAHRKEYDNYVLEPARAFIEEMGGLLGEAVPGLHAEPKVNKSLFKIHRDTRFANDKTPFKDHLGIWLWEGEAPRMHCSGFYFHFEPGRLMVGAGLYMFPREIIDEFRRSVVHLKQGPALAKAMDEVRARGYVVGGQRLRRTPKGYDPDHELADLLLYKGLFAMDDGPMPKEAASGALVDYCLERWTSMLPLHQWLAAMVARAAG